MSYKGPESRGTDGQVQLSGQQQLGATEGGTGRCSIGAGSEVVLPRVKLCQAIRIDGTAQR
jgi:hypothetical protein